MVVMESITIVLVVMETITPLLKMLLRVTSQPVRSPLLKQILQRLLFEVKHVRSTRYSPVDVENKPILPSDQACVIASKACCRLGWYFLPFRERTQIHSSHYLPN